MSKAERVVDEAEEIGMALNVNPNLFKSEEVAETLDADADGNVDELDEDSIGDEGEEYPETDEVPEEEFDDEDLDESEEDDQEETQSLKGFKAELESMKANMARLEEQRRSFQSENEQLKQQMAALAAGNVEEEEDDYDPDDFMTQRQYRDMLNKQKHKAELAQAEANRAALINSISREPDVAEVMEYRKNLAPNGLGYSADGDFYRAQALMLKENLEAEKKKAFMEGKKSYLKQKQKQRATGNKTPRVGSGTGVSAKGRKPRRTGDKMHDAITDLFFDNA